MASAENISLRDFQEFQSAGAELQSSVNSIMSLVSDNKHALFSLCVTRPDLLSQCRKQFGISDKATDSEATEYIRKRLFDDDVPIGPTAAPKQIVDMRRTWDAKMKVRRQNTTGKLQKNHTEKHFLDIGDRCLTCRGYPEEGKTAVDYIWMTPSDFIKYWYEEVKDKEHGFYHGIYALRLQGRELVRGNVTQNTRYFKDVYVDSQELCGKPSIRVAPISSVYVLQFMISALYSALGNCVTQALGELVMDAWVGKKGSKSLLSDIFVPSVYLTANDIDMSDYRLFLKLPGTFKIGDVEDSIYINNDNINRIKEERGNRTSVYKWFNNPCYYSEILRTVIKRAMDTSPSRAAQVLDETVQFLFLPNNKQR